uniref:MP n=1 Tax=Melampyrum betaflexivirus 1 TaxID=2794405 RepID=A0A7T5QZ63_9VIRU|nr:MP [Melampyrum betaflexivirus 1]
MSIVKANEFIKSYNSGNKSVECIHTDSIYKDSGFTKTKFVDVVQRNECAISVESPNSSSIITGVPFVHKGTIVEEKRKGGYKWLNIGAIPVSIHKLGYYGTEETTGTVFIVDGRKKGGNCVVKAYDFDISKKPAHYLFVPNANFSLDDEFLHRACEVYVRFNNNIYKEGSQPFAIEIGSIFRLTNALNCLHKMGDVDNGSFGGHHQEIFNTVGWDTEKHLEASKEYNDELFKSGLFLLEPSSRPNIVEGKRSVWRRSQRGPSRFIDYKVRPVHDEHPTRLVRSSSVRSSIENIDEFRTGYKLLDHQSRNSVSFSPCDGIKKQENDNCGQKMDLQQRHEFHTKNSTKRNNNATEKANAPEESLRHGNS